MVSSKTCRHVLLDASQLSWCTALIAQAVAVYELQKLRKCRETLLELLRDPRMAALSVSEL